MYYHSLFFSPTGGTKKILKAFCKDFEITQKIDISYNNFDASYSFSDNDCCFIGVPSFGGRVPKIALERLRLIKAVNTQAFLVVSFGNRAIDDTLLELKEEVEKIGFIVVGALAAVAEHSIVRAYGKDRPDAQDLQELAQFSAKAKSYLEAPDLLKKTKSLVFPGKKPYKEYNGVSFKPSGNSRCYDCKACVFSCPVHAIPLDNPKKTDKNLCITCMRCVYICPKKSRHINFFTSFLVARKLKTVCLTRKENILYI